MKYAYPAIFSPDENGYRVTVPDLPGTITYGDSLADALEMAQDAIEMWLYDAENSKEDIPAPSDSKSLDVSDDHDAIVSYVSADTDEYRKRMDSRAVKKTLTIPSWLNYQAEKHNAPFSQILQQGLKSYLGINE